jgi:hypothetical protein
VITSADICIAVGAVVAAVALIIAAAFGWRE